MTSSSFRKEELTSGSSQANDPTSAFLAEDFRRTSSETLMNEATDFSCSPTAANAISRITRSIPLPYVSTSPFQERRYAAANEEMTRKLPRSFNPVTGQRNDGYKARPALPYSYSADSMESSSSNLTSEKPLPNPHHSASSYVNDTSKPIPSMYLKGSRTSLTCLQQQVDLHQDAHRQDFHPTPTLATSWANFQRPSSSGSQSAVFTLEAESVVSVEEPRLLTIRNGRPSSDWGSESSSLTFNNIPATHNTDSNQQAYERIVPTNSISLADIHHGTPQSTPSIPTSTEMSGMISLLRESKPTPTLRTDFQNMKKFSWPKSMVSSQDSQSRCGSQASHGSSDTAIGSVSTEPTTVREDSVIVDPSLITCDSFDLDMKKLSGQQPFPAKQKVPSVGGHVIGKTKVAELKRKDGSSRPIYSPTPLTLAAARQHPSLMKRAGYDVAQESNETAATKQQAFAADGLASSLQRKSLVTKGSFAMPPSQLVTRMPEYYLNDGDFTLVNGFGNNDITVYTVFTPGQPMYEQLQHPDSDPYPNPNPDSNRSRQNSFGSATTMLDSPIMKPMDSSSNRFFTDEKRGSQSKQDGLYRALGFETKQTVGDKVDSAPLGTPGLKKRPEEGFDSNRTEYPSRFSRLYPNLNNKSGQTQRPVTRETHVSFAEEQHERHDQRGFSAGFDGDSMYDGSSAVGSVLGKNYVDKLGDIAFGESATSRPATRGMANEYMEEMEEEPDKRTTLIPDYQSWDYHTQKEEKEGGEDPISEEKAEKETPPSNSTDFVEADPDFNPRMSQVTLTDYYQVDTKGKEEEFQTEPDKDHRKFKTQPESLRRSDTDSTDFDALSHALNSADLSFLPDRWPLSKKIWQTLILGIYVFALEVLGSGYSESIPSILGDLKGDKSAEKILGLGLAIFSSSQGSGLTFGCGFVSFRRKKVLLYTLGVVSSLSILAAFVKNAVVILLIQWFFGNTTGVVLLVMVATIVDLFVTYSSRLGGLLILMLAVICGQLAGPWIARQLLKHLSWSWQYWTMLVFSAIMLAMIGVLTQETNSFVIFSRHAPHLQNPSQSGSTDSSQKNPPVLSAKQMFNEDLKRPYRVFSSSWNLPLITLSATFFASVYMFMFHGIYLVFLQDDDLSETMALLALTISSLMGVGCGIFGLVIFNSKTLVEKNVRTHSTYAESLVESKNLEPKTQKVLCGFILGSVFFSVSLFTLALTAEHNSTWIFSSLAVIMNTAGFLMIIVSTLQYAINAYSPARLIVIRDLMTSGNHPAVVTIPRSLSGDSSSTDPRHDAAYESTSSSVSIRSRDKRWMNETSVAAAAVVSSTVLNIGPNFIGLSLIAFQHMNFQTFAVIFASVSVVFGLAPVLLILYGAKGRRKSLAKLERKDIERELKRISKIKSSSSSSTTTSTVVSSPNSPPKRAPFSKTVWARNALKRVCGYQYESQVIQTHHRRDLPKTNSPLTGDNDLLSNNLPIRQRFQQQRESSSGVDLKHPHHSIDSPYSLSDQSPPFLSPALASMKITNRDKWTQKQILYNPHDNNHHHKSNSVFAFNLPFPVSSYPVPPPAAATKSSRRH